MRVRNEQRRKYMGSEKFSWEEMRIALSDPKLFFSGVIQFCQDILLYGFSTFLPTILEGMGYDSLMSNVLTVPVYIWAAIVFVAVAFCSDRYSKFASVCDSEGVSSQHETDQMLVHLHCKYFWAHRLRPVVDSEEYGCAVLCDIPDWHHYIHGRWAQCCMAQREHCSTIQTRFRDRLATNHGQLCRHRGWPNLSPSTLHSRQCFLPGRTGCRTDSCHQPGILPTP